MRNLQKIQFCIANIESDKEIADALCYFCSQEKLNGPRAVTLTISVKAHSTRREAWRYSLDVRLSVDDKIIQGAIDDCKSLKIDIQGIYVIKSWLF
jgi:hypothetical protein